jgi:hypothetical protein
VQRLKDMCTETFRERDQAVMDCDRLKEENRRLKNQLATSTSHLSPSDTYAMSDVTRNSSFSAPYADTPPRATGRKVESSIPDSHREPIIQHVGGSSFTSDTAQSGFKVENQHAHASDGYYSPNTISHNTQIIDYDELALDFVLT